MPNLIHVEVALSGRAAELSSEARLEYALVPPATLATLLELIGAKRPELDTLLPACRVTVNEQPAGAGAVLSDGDRVGIDSR